MTTENNIVIIGGTACGPKAAARARRLKQHARITLIEQGEYLSTATCGMPYYISGVIDKQDSMFGRKPDYFRNVLNLEVLTRTRATAINREAHKLELLNLDTDRVSNISYDKLVLATGSTPTMPNFEGKDLQGIYTLSKIEDALTIRNLVSDKQKMKVTIIGAGLIGLEMAEAFASIGFEVTVAEALDWSLPALLDFEIAAHVDKHIRSKGVDLKFGQKVLGFKGDSNGWVSKVVMQNSEIETGLVLLAIGTRPNTGLAKDAGLTIGAAGGVSVNQYMQTSDPDIYAGGDCVENVNRITGEMFLAPLGSTANKHGRVIGTNVTGGSDTFPGVVGTAIAKVFDYNVARVGLGEAQAQKAGYELVTCLIPENEHAGYYPNAKQLILKLVVDKSNNRILGGQAVGQGNTAKRIDVLATAISFGASVDDIANLDLAYAPPYNSAMDPLHNAANVIRNKQSGFGRAITPMQVKSKLDNGEDFVLLDVRRKEEWDEYRIDLPQVKLLPTGELRKKLDTLQKGKETILYCKVGVRAYQSQLVLDDAGFERVKYMDGSIDAWPYDVLRMKPDSDE
ncbi:FAD-dependent oxidoreductase [Chloroflexota bacterium]